MSDWSSRDIFYMQRAFRLAEAQLGRTGKNPAVGCVVVSSSDKIVAEGVTGDGGVVHAEEFALESLSGRAEKLSMYVTLEPCRKRSSSNPSCSSLILASGITRVICATEDFHPLGAGGINFLRENGIDVVTGLMKEKGRKFYAEFFETVTRKTGELKSV